MLKLTADDRRLLLAFGCPWPRIQRDLRALEKERRARLVAIDEHEFSYLFGDLSYSTSHTSDALLAEALSVICELPGWEERRLKR